MRRARPRQCWPRTGLNGAMCRLIIRALHWDLNLLSRPQHLHLQLDFQEKGSCNRSVASTQGRLARRSPMPIRTSGPRGSSKSSCSQKLSRTRFKRPLRRATISCCSYFYFFLLLRTEARTSRVTHLDGLHTHDSNRVFCESFALHSGPHQQHVEAASEKPT